MNATVEQSLKKLEAHKEKIVGGELTVAPGLPQVFTRGMAPMDAIAQGDLNLILVESIPDNFKLRKNRDDNQLVPGNTEGSKHCVVDMSTCDVLNPPGWSAEYDNLLGPVIVAKSDTTIGHPTHGAVTILAGQTVQCQYQRVWEEEQKKERRQRD